MIETTTFRRVAATLTIGSFSVAALMGIAALLGGGDFGEGEAKILLTTLIVGSASINLLCYLATAGTRFASAGALGAAVVVVPVATSLHLVWQDWNDVPEGELKVFGIGVVAAVTLAQVCLLLALAGERENLRVVLWATVALAALVAVVVGGLIVGEIEADGVWRVLGVSAILDVLGTLVTIALSKFGGHGAPTAPAAYGRRQVTLSAAQTAELEQLARSTGRSVDELVAEALAGYLHTAQTATGAAAE
ncbi:MAG: CopG family transcriptional regulator [Marmoricola sp.]